MSQDVETHPTGDCLAGRIRDGELSAEEELVDRFYRRVLVMALARTRDPETARDLVQETMMAVLSGVRDGKLQDPDRLPGFVRGTARNLINNHLRVHNHRPHPSVAENASILPDPEERAYLGERMQLISTGLAELSPQDRLILLLTLVDGLHPREIADRLGLRSDLVRKRKSRAVARLRTAVEQVSRR